MGEHLRFSAGTTGTGPATWGQLAIWDAVRHLGADAARYNVSIGAPVRPGLPESRVRTALGHLFDLHDSLRTRLHEDADGQLRQTLDAEGHIPVVVRECAVDAVDTEGEALRAELIALPFDCTREWPMRVGMVLVAGEVHYIVLSLSHTAVDGFGLRQLVLNLSALSAGEPVDSVRARVPALQPLREAEYQASDRGQRQDANARRHWRRKLKAGAPQQFSAQYGQRETRPFPNAVLTSPALATAVDFLVAEHRVSSSAVLLAAVSIMTSRLSGAPDVLFQVVVNNRFLPGLAHAVSTIDQESLFHLPAANAEFVDVLRRTQSTSLNTFRNAYYHKLLLGQDIAEVLAEEGQLADHSCIINDLRGLMPMLGAEEPVTAPLAAARDRTTLRWPTEFPPRRNVTFALDVADVPGAIELAMTADSAAISRPDMERLLTGIEDLVLAEALLLGCA